jgi:ATP-dependent Clp protease ATP-binding subunit ClpX
VSINTNKDDCDVKPTLLKLQDIIDTIPLVESNLHKIEKFLNESVKIIEFLHLTKEAFFLNYPPNAQPVSSPKEYTPSPTIKYYHQASSAIFSFRVFHSKQSAGINEKEMQLFSDVISGSIDKLTAHARVLIKNYYINTENMLANNKVAQYEINLNYYTNIKYFLEEIKYSECNDELKKIIFSSDINSFNDFKYIDYFDANHNIDFKYQHNFSKKIHSPKDIYHHLCKFVIGQEVAKRAISNSLFLHLNSVSNPHHPTSNNLLIGPSGTGKTYLLQTACDFLDLPFILVDISQFTGTGWSGKDVVDIFQEFLILSTIDKSSRAIVFFDEIDKIANRSADSRYTHNTEEVQNNLLKIIEGIDLDVIGGSISTHNMLFFFAGAFSGIDEIIAKRVNEKATIGFNKKLATKETQSLRRKSTPADLIKYGLKPEFVGRINNISRLHPLSKSDLMEILELPNSVLSRYRFLFKDYKLPFPITKDRLVSIIDESESDQTGFRGVQTKIIEILDDAIFDIDVIDG